MKYTIQSISPLPDKTTGIQAVDTYGNKRFKLFVKDPEGQIVEFNKGYKGEPPKAGEEIEGTIEQKEGQYGKYYQFTAERQGFNSSAAGRNDPEVQRAIIRQNSLTNAVAYCVAKANLMEKEKALKFLTGKEVLNVATYFAMYSEGKVVASDESIEKPVETEFDRETDQEIDLDAMEF